MNEYAARINTVIDYIEGNLGKKLTLNELAGVANSSKYHFHRIFAAFTGETLFHFIQRRRLEKSAAFLSSRPDLSITEIALDCGFAGSASFSKSFSAFFGCSPSVWRKKKGCPQAEDSKMGKQVSKLGKETRPPLPYIEYRNGRQVWRMKTETEQRIVEVREIPSLTLAYIRYTGPYQGDLRLFQRLWEKLATWAGARDLIRPETLFLALYHDDPELTEDQFLRVTIGISVEEGTEVSGEVGRMKLAGGKYACAQFRLGAKDYQEAWDWVYSVWLPVSGYLLDDRPAFELFPREENKPGGEKHRVDICIPVRPAR